MKKQIWLAIACACLLAADNAERPAPPAEARIEHCLVSLIDSVQVPAQEAGVLISIAVREGQQVELGQRLAQIQDTQARLAKDAAEAERNVSEEKANNDVDVRYAQAAHEVAINEHKFNEAANKSVAGTKSAVELEKLKLAVKQASLQIEKSKHEQQIARYQTDANTAKVATAQDDIERRRLVAPLAGEVAEVMFHPGEWVQPGNPVLRIVRLDRLRIEGFLNTAEFSPRQVSGRNVRVEIPMAQGQTEVLTGRIVFVDSLVQAGGEYRIWAEVANRRDGEHWLLRPGMEGRLTIDTRSTVANAPAQAPNEPVEPAASKTAVDARQNTD